MNAMSSGSFTPGSILCSWFSRSIRISAHAEEVGRGMPTTIVVGAKSRDTAEYIQNLFMNEVFRVYVSPDILGMELGGALSPPPWPRRRSSPVRSGCQPGGSWNACWRR